MAVDSKKEIECFEKDYDKIYAKETWTKDDISMMKDLKKLIYYNLVIDAMQNGESYPGSEYMPDTEMRNSFARYRNPMNGQYVSHTGGHGMNNGMNNNGSGMYYPPYMDGNTWDGRDGRGMNMSGRRYYDSEKEKAIHKLHHMMENEDNAEKKNALKLAVTVLEEQK